MTQPRQNIVSVADTPYYHCIGEQYGTGIDWFYLLIGQSTKKKP